MNEISALRVHFGIWYSMAQTLLLLIENDFVPASAIEDDLCITKSARHNISRLRHCLKPFGMTIHHLLGVGYYMSKDDREAAARVIRPQD
jgi:hypothetical protein